MRAKALAQSSSAALAMSAGSVWSLLVDIWGRRDAHQGRGQPYYELTRPLTSHLDQALQIQG